MNSIFRQEVLEKRRLRLSGGVVLIQPPAFKYLAIFILAIILISIIFLSLGSYSKKVKVSGVLQPDSGLLKLVAPQSGIVTEVLVREGERVIKDQPLLRIKSEKHGVKGFDLKQALIDQQERQSIIIKEQLEKQKQQHLLEKKELKASLNSLIKRASQVDSQQKVFLKRIKINQQIAKQVDDLANSGFISELELKKQEDKLLALNQQIYSIEADKLLVNSEIEKIKSSISQLPFVQTKEINLLEAQLVSVNTQISTFKQQRLSELRAPADGIITGLLIKAGKSVINEQKLLSILPQDSEMQAIIYVPTSSFGFIQREQKIRLRYHAFPYQRFGTYLGSVSQTSVNVILPSETDPPNMINTPSYRVVITLDNQEIEAYGRKFFLRSGMKLDADIIIDNQSLIRWLFDPVFSIKGQL